MNAADLRDLLTVVGLVAVTVVTRTLFFLSSSKRTLPAWAERALRYAPVAAIAAVLLPEIVISQGRLVTTWHDARIIAALVAIGWYAWRRGVLGTIVVGMAVYLPLHIGLGW